MNATWASTAILLTYDENGGFFDHVPPEQLDAFGPGLRVPMLIVSPYAKPGFVDTTFSDPGSVLKFIEKVFGLPTLASINHQFDTSTPTTNNDTNGAPFSPRDGNPATSDLTQCFTFPGDVSQPVLSNVAASASYSAGATATTLSSGTTVSDPESANLVSGTVSISSATFLTGDTLAAVGTGTSITASYNTSTGVLSLTGSDTLAHYQQVLDSVSYSSSSQNPTNSGADPSRPVSWVVNDGTLNSATQITTINITGWGADTGTAHGGVASVTGPNPPATARSFDGVAGSYISLAFSPFDWNSGPYSVCGRIYVTNNNVLGPGGFNQHFFYDDRAGDGTNYMKVSLRTVVGAGVLTFSRSGHGFYTAVNTIANNTWLDFEFTDSGGSTPIQTIYINGAVGSTTPAPGDLSGHAIASSIGTVTSSAGNLAGRESDLRVYNRVLSASEATQFHLATDATNGLIHAWELDDSHVSGTTITDDITTTITPPVLSNVAASAAYSAGATATTLSSGTTVSDPDSANLVSGTVSISSGTFLTGDTLAAVTTGTSITASYNTSTGVLSLTGSDTLAHYQQVLDSVSYSSSSQNPTNSGAD